MKHRLRARSSAFTIVELVVVIGIIGILALIILVAYSGVKSQGYNAQIVQGVDQYMKAIETYKGLNGTYPKVTGENNKTLGVFMTCLGTGYPSAQCGKVTGKTIVEDSLFNGTISDVIGKNIPLIGKNVMSGGASETFIGAVYGIDTIDPAQHPGNYGRVIEYALMGKNTNCGVANAYQYASGTNPDTTLCEVYLEQYPK